MFNFSARVTPPPPLLGVPTLEGAPPGGGGAEVSAYFEYRGDGAAWFEFLVQQRAYVLSDKSGLKTLSWRYSTNKNHFLGAWSYGGVVHYRCWVVERCWRVRAS